jgi:hypothetical protein
MFPGRAPVNSQAAVGQFDIFNAKEHFWVNQSADYSQISFNLIFASIVSSAPLDIPSKDHKPKSS